MEKAGLEFIIAFYSLMIDVGASVGAISFSCVANLIGSSTEFFYFKSVKERILVSCLQYTKIYAFLFTRVEKSDISLTELSL